MGIIGFGESLLCIPNGRLSSAPPPPLPPPVDDDDAASRALFRSPAFPQGPQLRRFIYPNHSCSISISISIFTDSIGYCAPVAALMAVKSWLRDEKGVMDGWDINSVDPCTWLMVCCSSDGFVISLFVPFFLFLCPNCFPSSFLA